MVLRAQLETTKQYQDQFISVVLWSLGGVLTTAAGLAVYSWFSYKRTYEHDRQTLERETQAIRSELKSFASTEIAEALSKMQATLTALGQSISDTVTKQAKVREQGISDEIAAVAERLLDMEIQMAKEAARNADDNTWLALYSYRRLLEKVLSAKQGYVHQIEIPECLDAIKKIIFAPGTRLDSDDIVGMVEVLKKLPDRYSAAAAPLLQKLSAWTP